MSARTFLLIGLVLTSRLPAVEVPLEDLLRQGLFEEEANHDLEKAAERYRAVIAGHDQERAFAATATFRLGEIARKKSDKDTAVTAFRTVIERFPEQQELVKLSRENLVTLGMAAAPDSKEEALPMPATVDLESEEISRLKEIQRNSPDLLDGADTSGWRPLHHAAEKGWTKVIAFLLENKASINGRTTVESLTPLHIACHSGHLEAVKALLAAKAEINATIEIANCPIDSARISRADQAKGNWTALDLAILYNRREIARQLVASGADIKRVGPQFKGYGELTFTPLLSAIILQRNEVAMDLIQAGASLGVSEGAPSVSHPLTLAVRENPEMVVPLLKAGADPNAVGTVEKTSPLHSAAFFDRLDLATLLVDAGAKVNALDLFGTSPLHSANSAGMVDYLVSKGADPNVKSMGGATALEISSRQQQNDHYRGVFQALIKHGATIADSRALLSITSKWMLPTVRDFGVYPKEQRPDAILLSVDGSYSLIEAGLQSSPDLRVIESRLSPGMPPPTLPEALVECFGSYVAYPTSIRVLRLNAAKEFEPVLSWTQQGSKPFDTRWPALQWGDIVEISVVSGFAGRASDAPPRLEKLREQIADRKVTFRIGDVQFQKVIPGTSLFWFDGKANVDGQDDVIPAFSDLIDRSTLIVHRKDLATPLALNLNAMSGTRFRLIDGDVVDLTLSATHLNVFCPPEDDPVYLTHGFMRRAQPGSILLGVVPGNWDFHNFLILHRANNWKPERFDFAAWIDKLPARDQWKKDEILASLPSVAKGDLVAYVENPPFVPADEPAKINKTLIELFTQLGLKLAPRTRSGK